MRKPQFTSEGIRHATINGHRLHLRLTDPTRENYLWIDGTQPALVLDQVAAEFVAHIIDGMWEFQAGEGDESPKVIDYVVDKMHQKYARRLSLRKVSKKRIRADLDRIFGTIMNIAEGRCPVEEGINEIKAALDDWIINIRAFNTYRKSFWVDMVAGVFSGKFSAFPGEHDYYQGPIGELDIDVLNPQRVK